MSVMQMATLITQSAKFSLPPLTQSPSRADEKHLKDAIKAQDESRERELALQRALQQEQEKAEIRHSAFEPQPEPATSTLPISSPLMKQTAAVVGSTPGYLLLTGTLEMNLRIPIRSLRNIQLKSSPLQPVMAMLTMYCGMKCTNDCKLDEAKKASVSAEQGRIQARLYADWLEKEYGQRPVILIHQRLRYLALG